jgi:UDP-N-acetylmuramyl pentapeptide synthase
MSVYVRLKEDWMIHHAGEDLALDAETAKFLQGAQKAWITGGDTGELAAHNIELDTEVGQPIQRKLQVTFAAEVERGS